MIKFKFTERDTEYYNNWISFYPKQNKGTGFNLTLSNNGYFDPRSQLDTNITSLLAIILPFISLYLIPISIILCFYSWGSLYINLPYDTGRGNTAEDKTYGLTLYHCDSGFPNQFWIRGYKSFDFPWAFKSFKREILLKDGWKKEEKGDDFWDTQKWFSKIKSETYPYRYTLKSGEQQNVNAEIHEEKRYFKRWFGLNIKCNHYIQVQFNSEVGERSGSWKGGVLGCSYLIKKGETALQCLKRMSKERKF